MRVNFRTMAAHARRPDRNCTDAIVIWHDARPSSADTLRRQPDQYSDQTCDRDHRRKSQLRSRICHVRSEERRNHSQPLVRRHHYTGRQEERDSRPAFRQGAPTGRHRHGYLSAQSAEAGVSEEPTACALGGRPERRQRLLFRQQPLQCRTARAAPVTARLRSADRKRSGRSDLLPSAGERRHVAVEQNSGSTHQQCRSTAGGSVSIDQRQHLRLQRLRGESGAPLLSNVAAVKLQC